ncbi:hypothetical protein Q7P37_008316 [Cladosporium fusiforme]
MGSLPQPPLLDTSFTRKVITAMGPNTPPRLREILSSLITHLHAFVLETQLTTDEWMLGIDEINRAGQMSDAKRNESQLLCDILGIESLVDDITFSAAAKQNGGGLDAPTASAILGPFWRNDHPVRPNGSTISFDTPADAQVVFMHGRVRDAASGKPIVGATVDIWQASTNGLYEQQDEKQRDLNLRGQFVTDSEGKYSLYCLRPTPYPVPADGPAGRLLTLMDRQPFRPAHIHLVVRQAQYQALTTQIFDKDCRYLGDDSVFAVKEGLSVAFVPRREEDAEGAGLELEYDIALAPRV